MRASQAIALERLIEGEELAKKPAALLKGLGAKLVRASDLPAPRFGSSMAAGEESFLESFVLGLPAHTLIEVVGRRSSGRFSIGLAAMASSTAVGESAALIDLGDNLDPQAAEQAGIDLTRVLWVRPRRVKEALSAAEMLLATGFRLVVADLGLSPRGGRFVPDAAWVRLQRAARSQESTLLLLVPYRMSGIAADVVVSATAARPLWQGSGQVPRLLTGIASRLMLEKRGRETPGRSAPLSLSVAEAITSDHSENFLSEGPCDSPRLANLRPLSRGRASSS